MMKLRVLPLYLAAAALGLACSGEEELNEDCAATGPCMVGGTCEAPGSGARVCYHAPAATDTWLPDCDHLSRDYWRVFRQQSGTAYLIPRPDGTGLSFGICGGSDAALDVLFDRLGLCSPFLPRGGVAAINALQPAEAAQVANALHARLRFEAEPLDGGGNDWGVQPFLPRGDIVEACDAFGSEVQALNDGLCESLRNQIRQNSCTTEFILYDQATAETLADWANRLYGVPTN